MTERESGAVPRHQPGGGLLLPFPLPRPCAEALARLEDYLDREMTPAEWEMVRVHLAACHGCAGIYRFEARVLAGLRVRLSRCSPPPGFRSRIHQRLALALPGLRPIG